MDIEYDQVYPPVHSLNGNLINISAFMDSHRPALLQFKLTDNDVKTPVVNCPLASDFGDYRAHSLKSISNESLIAAGLLQMYMLRGLGNPTYDTMQSLLLNAAMLTHSVGQAYIQSKTLVNDETKLQVVAAPSPAELSRVKTWIHEVIDDDEVYEALLMDDVCEHLARFITQSSNIRAIDIPLGKNERRAPVMDVSVIRFPDVNADHFFLYGLRIENWNTTTFNLRSSKFVKQTVGLSALYQHVKFRANVNIIRSLDSSTKERGIQRGIAFYTVKDHVKTGFAKQTV